MWGFIRGWQLKKTNVKRDNPMNLLGQADTTAFQQGWGEYGLAGMVIGALFVTLYVLGRFALDKFDKIAERHDATVSQMDVNHREERREWQQESIRRETAMQAMVADVTSVIRDLKKE